jgi:cytochrome c oxidase cbb3-type subunit 1
MVLYFVTCFQCALQVTMTFQQLIHFTDWVVGHAHLVMFGVFSQWLLGIMTYLIPRLTGKAWHSRTLCEWHYWLSAVGIVVMFLDLTMAGLFQGWSWASMQPWDHSTQVSQPFWIVRIFAGLAMFGGQLVFTYNIYRTLRGQQPEPVEELRPVMA